MTAFFRDASVPVRNKDSNDTLSSLHQCLSWWPDRGKAETTFGKQNRYKDVERSFLVRIGKVDADKGQKNSCEH